VKTETRTSRATLPTLKDDPALRVAQDLGISLELWNAPGHHGVRLLLGPVCALCEREDVRTFDRCRKRRAYLTRPEVDLPAQLAEKCPRKVRLARSAPNGSDTGPTLFAFGYAAAEPSNDTDTAIQAFLHDLRGHLASGRDNPETARGEGEHSEILALFEAARGKLPWLAPAVAPADARTAELVAALVTGLESRRPAQRGHALRVRLLALLLGRELALPTGELEALHWAALLHGAGALGSAGPTDGEVCALDAAGGSSVEERIEATWRSLHDPSGCEGMQAILRHQRDRWKEPGEVPLGARCLAVADALDILLAADPPRRPRTLRTAIAALAASAAGRFDPAVLEALRRLQPWLERHVWIFLLQRRGL